MSWTSPLTVPITTVPLPPASAFSMCGSRYGDRRLHRLGALQHERQLHLARSEEVADDLHAVEQHVVDDRERGQRAELLVEIGFEAVAVAVDDAVLQPLLDRPARTVFALDGAGLDAFEQRHELGERVVALAATVVDEVEGDLSHVVVDAVHRHDARRVHDRGVEAGLAALVQEHAVEHVAGGGLEAEADVRQAEDGRDARQLGLDAPDGLDGLDAVCGSPRRRSRAGT